MTTHQDLERLERIRHVTANYRDYQGLQQLPVALFVLSLLLVRDGEAGWLLISLPVLMVLSALVRRYYRRRFGSVQALSSPGRTAVYMFVLVGFIVCILLAANLSAAFGWSYGPLGAAGLVFAVFFVALAYTHWRMRAHYLVAGAVIGLAGLLPLGMLMPSGVHPLSFAATESLLAAFAAVLCIGGLLDHRTLVRTLPPVTETAQENGTD